MESFQGSLGERKGRGERGRSPETMGGEVVEGLLRPLRPEDARAHNLLKERRKLWTEREENRLCVTREEACVVCVV